MNKENKRQGWFAIIAAIIVLFSAMLNPLVSVGISVIALVVFAVLEFMKK